MVKRVLVFLQHELNFFNVRHASYGDSWPLSRAFSADFNPAAGAAQPAYHVQAASPVIFLTPWSLSHASMLCILSHFPLSATCFGHSFTALILLPFSSITLHCSHACGRSIDLVWDCGKCFNWLFMTHTHPGVCACTHRQWALHFIKGRR